MKIEDAIKFADRIKFLCEELVDNHGRDADDKITFYVEMKDESFYELELDSVEIDRRLGCGCWIGVDIDFKEKKQL